VAHRREIAALLVEALLRPVGKWRVLRVEEGEMLGTEMAGWVQRLAVEAGVAPPAVHKPRSRRKLRAKP
jgi:hypothetical protein